MGGESRGTDLEIGFVGRKEKMRREEERGIDLCVMLCDVCVRWCVLDYGIF